MDIINQKQLEEIIKDFFKKIGVYVEVSFYWGEAEVLIKLKTDEPKILIGQNGQTLADIQHLLRVLISRQYPERFSVDFDVNDYKKKKVEYLKIIAKEAADEAALTGREKEFEPMPSYERRVIHMAVAERQDVIAESQGREPERRIVIKPRP